jgi:signal transduction histidine kinase
VRRRLWIQIWLAVLALVLVFAALLSVAWWRLGGRADERRILAGVATLAGDLLPPDGADPARVHEALARAAEAIGASLTLRAADGSLVAATGEPAPAVRAGVGDVSDARVQRRHGVVSLRLDDGRWLSVERDHGPAGAFAFLLGLALAIALGAYPVVRRITARLERLQRQVDALGRGELSARVEVRGDDEVASLARSFNAAAARIEALVSAQRDTLAAASHELRSPLARLRMALELLAGDARPELRARVARDIAELDQLVDEILLASRLDALGPRAAEERVETVDLLALVAEECARQTEIADALAEGEAALVRGDPALLRRLVRNLLDNARRHAPGAAVRARVAAIAGGGARLEVEDDGPGVPEDERERVFEPFHRAAGRREGAGGGAGLGLALVRRIARLHGGEARCGPLPSGAAGTRFQVTLPGVGGAAA